MSHIPPLAKVRRHVEMARAVLADLDDVTVERDGRRVSVLEALHDRHRFPVSDGYPASAVGGDVSSGGVADPTGSVALLEDPADPVRAAIAEIFAGLSEVAGILRHVDRRRAYVMAAGDAMVGHVSSLGGGCAACARPVAGTEADRLRAGYCDTCYRAWRRAGCPDRATFEAQRGGDMGTGTNGHLHA